MKIVRTQDQGFTLVELLITVSIVAILVAVAYPTFVDSVQSGRRADAMSSLLQLQQEQEMWRATNATYGALANVWTGTDSLDGYYTLSVTSNTAADFIAQAAPKAGGPQVGDTCGTFRITRNGPVYTSPYADRVCWKR